MTSLHKRELSLNPLKHWFEGQKRDFPWRKDRNPYRIWVSEVMLQQTRAAVVVSYFEKWMERFPTISSLAKSKEEEVIKLWEGLGYYSRARNLRLGAQFLMREYGGRMPDEEVALLKVKGIGLYTARAILSFAFQKKAAAVDGNVLRVMTRLLAIPEEIDRPKVKKKIASEVLALLPHEHPFLVMEALIELGATVCMPKPDCFNCPLQDNCLAHALSREEEFPHKKKRAKVTLLYREVFVIECEGWILLQKHRGNQIMSGLYEFPYIERAEKNLFFGQVERISQLPSVIHTFTRYKAHLSPSLWKAKEHFEKPGFVWVESKRLSELAFSSGHRKILNQLLEDYADLTH